MKSPSRSAAGLAALLLAAPALARFGLSTRFVQVTVAGLEPGKSHSVRDLPELAYSLRNPGDKAVEVTLAAEPPPAGEVEPPYEPIPDRSWVRFSPDRLRIPAGKSAEVELFVVLPDDPRLAGRHFEASLWARTAPRRGLVAAVRSRLRFSVGPAPEDADGRSGSGERPPCTLGSEDVFLRGVRAGGPEQTFQLKVENPGAKALELVPHAVRWPAAASGPRPLGFQAAETLDWVGFRPGRLHVAGRGSASIEVALTAPQELRGRRISFAVQAEDPARGTACRERRVYIDFK